jgi:hypothetical protein
MIYGITVLTNRVADPYSFHPDPDPDPASYDEHQSGTRALMTKNLKKNYSRKKYIYFFNKNCNLPIPRPP